MIHWVDQGPVEGLKEISDWDEAELAELREAGFTIVAKPFVEYQDGTQVEIPDSIYLDSIKAEKHFKQPWSQIREFEGTVSWCAHLRLSRHPVEAARPTQIYDLWVQTIERFLMRGWYDPSEPVVPLA